MNETLLASVDNRDEIVYTEMELDEIFRDYQERVWKKAYNKIMKDLKEKAK